MSLTNEMKFIDRVLALRDAGEILLAQQTFQEELNKTCPEEYIKKDFRGFDTLMISYVEMMLDGYFLGEWDTQNFKWQVVENEIVATIQLCVSNPITEKVRCLSGAAAIQILVPKDTPRAEKLNIKEHKIVNTLESAFPKLEKMCIKSAAKKLGKRFGRDLNRKQYAKSAMLLIQEISDDDLLNEL